jgi:hypothetical protein
MSVTYYVHIAAVFWVFTQCSVSILTTIRVEGIGVWTEVEEIRVTPCFKHVHGMKRDVASQNHLKGRSDITAPSLGQTPYSSEIFVDI